MAESNSPLTKNKAFLQQQERLRMSKPSSLAIDLRNKVAGECQAYQFGGITHYLDDRGYLLAKRLIERFDGRYTIGVYELLLKAIKTLAQTDAQLPTVKPTQDILTRDAQRVQLLHLDKLFQRADLRILYTTQIEIRIDDIVYHANSVDLSATAVRVVMKRAHTLNKHDIVLVSFTELTSGSEPRLLTDISHRIVKIEHDALRTYLILKRVDENAAVAAWFADWVKQHKTLSKMDVEHELLNTVHEFYLRLYHKTMKKPLIWLSKFNFSDPVKAIHLNSESEKTLGHLLDAKGNFNFSLLPIQQVITEQRDYLAIISVENDTAGSLVIPCDDRQSIASALSQPFEQALLLQSHSLTFSDDDFKEALTHLFELNAVQADSLQLRLSGISRLVTLSDITQSCQYLPQATSAIASDLSLLTNKQVLSTHLPMPKPLHHHIERKKQRFLIHTDVSLYLMNEHLTVSTNDVSETGLSLEVAGHFPVTEGTILRINFIRWQNKTSKVKLNDVPFVVRRMQYWEGITSLGLERNVIACGEKLNKFFVETIEENKDQLALDSRDRFVIQESKMLGSQLTHTMPNLPFYLGRDNDNKRIIQAIANTEANQAIRYVGLWQAISELATNMSELVRVTLDDFTPITDFGIYCYQDKNQQWQLQTEHDFSSVEQKSVFINRALLADNYRFFHCDLTAIKNTSIEQEPDLEQQLSRLRRHSPHQIRRIREVLQSLFAVGDLTDITPIVEAVFAS